MSYPNDHSRNENGRVRYLLAATRPPLWLILGAAVLLVSGCSLVAKKIGIGQVQARPSKHRIDHLYFSLEEKVEDFDLTAVRGRRIVIDPGHGGRFAGATGPYSLEEADVNLGVALHLWGVLTDAGAEVKLTRSADTNVVRAEDFTLKEDLQSRCDVARDFSADLFISIHHNADIVPGSQKNSLETYYPLLNNAGPSFDLAQRIHRHLVINLKRPENSLVPGNFFVLRNSPCTAILGEPSYITNEENEFKLSLVSMQRLEAEAYFLGIVEYLSLGVPRIDDLAPAGLTLANARPLITAGLIPDRGVSIDPSSIVLTVDGEVVSHRYNPETGLLEYLPAQPLPNGSHTITLDARNVNGNATRRATSRFSTSLPPARIEVKATPSRIRPDGRSRAEITALVLDENLNPVYDGTEVQFSPNAVALMREFATTSHGRASSYIVAGTQPGAAEISVRSGGVSKMLQVNFVPDSEPVATGFVIDQLTGEPVADALLKFGHLATYTNGDGWFSTVGLPDGKQRLEIRRAGYIPYLNQVDVHSGTKLDELKLRPVADGVLNGKVLVIDPQYGGEITGAVNPNGLRACDVNLNVARYLAQFLQGAGASVFLTRSGDETLTPLQRVMLSMEVDADIFVSIGHGVDTGGNQRHLGKDGFILGDDIEQSTYVAHYPGSPNGTDLAASVLSYLQRLVPSGRGLSIDSAEYTIVHTACPSITTHSLSAAYLQNEPRLLSAAFQRSEAYAIYCGVLEHFGISKSGTGNLKGKVVNSDSGPLANALVTVDGLYPLVTESDGKFRFYFLSPGEHQLRVICPDHDPYERTVQVSAGKLRSITVSCKPAG